MGAGEVRLVLTKPDGMQTAVPRIPIVCGSAKNGQWRYSWVLPGNTTSSPMVYAGKVYDADVFMTPSQTISVTVPGKPASTLPLPSPTALPRRRQGETARSVRRTYTVAIEPGGGGSLPLREIPTPS